MNKNRPESRICHTCKGRLMVAASKYILKSFQENTSYYLELKCYRCNIVYVLMDDKLMHARVNDVVSYPPFLKYAGDDVLNSFYA